MQTIYRLVNFLKKVDEEWVKENIPSTYDPQDFDNKCKEFLTKYPLIENLAKQVYSWQNLDEDNFGKNIVDYIFLCDLVGEVDWSPFPHFSPWQVQWDVHNVGYDWEKQL